MKIALVQYSPLWEDKENNRTKIQSLISESDLADVSLLIFPEMTLSGFSMQASKLAENIKGDSFVFFSSIAQQYNINVIAGLIEYDNDNFYNTMIHIDNKGSFLNRYRKIHPFSYSHEDKYYTRGEKPVITRIDKMNVGLSICYDLRFPELYRLYAKNKPELIINIANWPEERIEHWKTLLKARAIENQCFIIGVNRVGSDPFLSYNGFSSVFGPMGELVLSINDSEKIDIADINLDEVKIVREKLPFLNDIKLI